MEDEFATMVVGEIGLTYVLGALQDGPYGIYIFASKPVPSEGCVGGEEVWHSLILSSAQLDATHDVIPHVFQKYRCMW